MADASADRANVARSLIIWAVALVAAILVAFVVGGLLGLGTAPGLVFGALVFVVLPYLVPSGRKGTSAAAPAGHVAPPPVQEPLAPTMQDLGAPKLAEVPVAAPEATMVHEDATPAATGVALSERVREAARAAGEAARAAAGDLASAERPAALEAPRGGAADDLKRIKGVGPKLEGLLHSLGVYHFDQIAAWGPAEVAWMDSNLEGFSGRVVREDWVRQATVLAAGGETEHSQRVDRGEST
jgi:predicted flap endonuclease-1-like 5' DNA nuclease